MTMGKWATGIPPRNFTWVVADRLGVSERPGGFGGSHRRVRRHEEILWLRGQGFTRIVSLLPSPHNLAAYEEEGFAFSHLAQGPTVDARTYLAGSYRELDGHLAAGDRVLVHQDELSDRVTGFVAGFLVWSGLIGSGPGAVALLEREVGHRMGPDGRQLVVVAGSLQRPRAV